MREIHSTAIVSPKAELGENVVVGPYAIIEDNVQVGDGTNVGSTVQLASGAVIGENVKIFHSAVIGTIPQDLKFGGEETKAVIGDSTVVREFATVNRGTVAHGETTVGQNCMLMAYSHVAHDCIIGNNVILANSVNLAGGYPLHLVGLNAIGLRRRGFKREVIQKLEAAFRVLFFSDLNTSQAVERIKSEIEMIPEVQVILDFIEKSNRGMIK
jgi:UDP-N-acetylglucosamine acyltransferase